MGMTAGLRRAAAPVGSLLNTKLQALFQHITNEAQDTRRSIQDSQESLARRLDDLGRHTDALSDRVGQVVDPAMSTVAEASTLLQHAALRVERRLAELSLAAFAGEELDRLAANRGAVEVPFSLAALSRCPDGGGLVVVGDLGLLAVLTAGSGHPTTVVGGQPCRLPGVHAIEDEAGWPGPSEAVDLVVHSLVGAVSASDVDRVLDSLAWLAPGGRLVVVAPAGEIDDVVGVLSGAGWGITRQAWASNVEGAWRSTSDGSKGVADLRLVELSLDTGAGAV